MPSCGGPVYQPTTVSYGPRSGSGNSTVGGLRFLRPASSAESSLRLFRQRKFQIALLLIALLSLAAGISMLVRGTNRLIADQELAREWLQQAAIEQTTDDEVSKTQTEAVSSCSNLAVSLLAVGGFMTIVGIIEMGWFNFVFKIVVLVHVNVVAVVLFVGIYFKYADWRRNCVCPCPCTFFNKKQSLARQLQCQNVDGGCGQGIMALNPSTDPLVSHTQYAPVSELPSLRADEEERRNLMPDNKDW